MQRNPNPRPVFCAILLLAFLALPTDSSAQASAQPPTTPGPDVVVFTNGDRLSGTLSREIGGTVSFHNDVLGDISIPLGDVKELHTRSAMAVVPKGTVFKRHRVPPTLPIGQIAVNNRLITVHPTTNVMIPPIPTANAEVIVDPATLNKQVVGRPGFFQAWNGSATLGFTVVQATQNQFTYAGSLGLVRVVPTVSWLDPRNRTTVTYAQSYGKITERSYTLPNGTFVPSTFTKTSIFHADAERDEYVSPRLFFLALVSFDHNFSQSLQLQQIYGVGIGYTLLKSPVQELDVKALIQYERQEFFDVVPPSPTTMNFIGSTFGASYFRQIDKGMLFTQRLRYIPTWNNLHGYSLSEVNALTFPAYRHFSFSIGTLNTYLNSVPPTLPPSKRNSFQFTAGLTYTFTSSY